MTRKWLETQLNSLASVMNRLDRENSKIEKQIRDQPTLTVLDQMKYDDLIETARTLQEASDKIQAAIVQLEDLEYSV